MRALAASGDETPIVTVFIQASRFRPLPKIRDQLLEHAERIARLSLAFVPVIAFAGFVVEPQNANIVDHEGQPIFEIVAASPRGLGKSPDHELDEAIFA
jgi:hypothetical protein